MDDVDAAIVVGDIVECCSTFMNGHEDHGIVVGIRKVSLPRGNSLNTITVYDILLFSDGQVWAMADLHYKIWKYNSGTKKNRDRDPKRGGG